MPVGLLGGDRDNYTVVIPVGLLGGDRDDYTVT
jgi:hypothetical protein